MATTVYVWPRSGGDVGHASIQIGNRYLSLWPAGRAGKKDVLLKRTHDAIFAQTYEEDFISEGRRPAQRIVLFTLNERAMLQGASEMLSEGCRYDLMKMNCSSFVAALLEIGSGQAPSFAPLVDPDEYVGEKGAIKLARSILLRRIDLRIWTPEQLLRYAQELERRAPRR